MWNLASTVGLACLCFAKHNTGIRAVGKIHCVTLRETQAPKRSPHPYSASRNPNFTFQVISTSAGAMIREAASLPVQAGISQRPACQPR